MPTTDDYDKRMEQQNRAERRQKAIFKVVEPILWLIVIIISITLCLLGLWASGYIQ
jgi:hypothetical protein